MQSFRSPYRRAGTSRSFVRSFVRSSVRRERVALSSYVHLYLSSVRRISFVVTALKKR